MIEFERLKNSKKGEKPNAHRREFDTCKSTTKSEYIEIKPYTANFLSNFMILLVLVCNCCGIIYI